MKQIKLILILMLTLSIVLGTFTSCDVLEDKLGIDLNGIFGGSTDDNNDDNKVVCEHYFEDGRCLFCGEIDPDYNNGNEDENKPGNEGENKPGPEENEIDAKKAEWKSLYQTITIAEALTMCEDFVSSPSSDRYYIIATVKSVDNEAFGQLTIMDETGEIMVYGTNSADGSLKYDQMGGDLKAGDLVLLYGTLQNYKGTTKEVQNGWLIDYVSVESAPVEPTITPDTEITIAEAIANAGLV